MAYKLQTLISGGIDVSQGRKIYSLFCFNQDKELVRISEISIKNSESLTVYLSRYISDSITYIGYAEMPLDHTMNYLDLNEVLAYYTRHSSFDISILTTA